MSKRKRPTAPTIDAVELFESTATQYAIDRSVGIRFRRREDVESIVDSMLPVCAAAMEELAGYVAAGQDDVIYSLASERHEYDKKMDARRLMRQAIRNNRF